MYWVSIIGSFFDNGITVSYDRTAGTQKPKYSDVVYKSWIPMGLTYDSLYCSIINDRV